MSKLLGYILKFPWQCNIATIQSMMFKPEIVFVLGPPGSGKGTQCQKISQEFGYIHLSAGELLRAEMNKEKSEFKTMISDSIKNGKIVPPQVTVSLLELAIQNSPQSGDLPTSDKFLIDGFPRNEQNLYCWKTILASKVNLKFTIFFDCSEEVCISRCLQRGSLGSKRTDDNIESIKKRFVTYFDETFPIIQYFENINILRKIDASKAIDQVYDDVRKLFEQTKVYNEN